MKVLNFAIFKEYTGYMVAKLRENESRKGMQESTPNAKEMKENQNTDSKKLSDEF